MAELAILLTDFDDDVELSIHGDTKTKGDPTPAQRIAFRIMNVAYKAQQEIENGTNQNTTGESHGP